MANIPKLPISCPSCSDSLQVSQLTCPSCNTQVSGNNFPLPVLLQLPQEEQDFILRFFISSGSLKEMASQMGVSYPTVRNKLDDLIEKIKPHQIFAAGDLADPHGTHKVCLDAIFEAVKNLKTKDFMNDCWLWLYRGAWQEWGIDEIEMAVPMSPDQVLAKRQGIFKHQSQKDGVVFQGTDSREFWQRAEDRNKETAELYDQLGLSNYAAMEAFVRWKF